MAHCIVYFIFFCIRLSKDVERVIAEEKNVSSEDGWRRMNRSEFTEVWRKSEAEKPVHLIRVQQ